MSEVSFILDASNLRQLKTSRDFAQIPAVVFTALAGLPARELAHALGSLVRVSRRVEQRHVSQRPCVRETKR